MAGDIGCAGCSTGSLVQREAAWRRPGMDSCFGLHIKTKRRQPCGMTAALKCRPGECQHWLYQNRL